MLYPKKQYVFFLIFCLSIFFSSCYQNRRLIYLQEEQDEKMEKEYFLQKPDYKVQVDDILYVKIASANSEASSFFDLYNENQYSNAQRNSANFYVTGYKVNKRGNIELPIIGAIEVIDLTTEQIKEKLQKKIAQYLKDAIVIVRFVSFRITIMGEVNREGVFEVYQNRINVYDALALAGGINIYGNKENVMILRPTENGNKIYTIDLTQRDMLESELFYLMPNDMVYVKPIRSKAWRLSISDYSLLLTTLSTTLTTVLLIINLTK